MKTILVNCSGVSYTMGIFVGKSLTDLWGYHAVPVVGLILTFIFIGFVVILPDTPEYLIFRNKLEEAERSLKFYRGVKPNDPLPEQYLMEFEELKNQIWQRHQKISLKDFSKDASL